MSCKRYQIDSIKNNHQVQVLESDRFVTKKNSEVRVGDVLLIRTNETVPADLVLLAAHPQIECFVDMSKITGGQNLVLKNPVKDTQSYINFLDIDIANLISHIENVRVSQPDSSFTSFSGKIKMKGNPKASRLKLKNFLLRETKIINSE